MKNILLSALLLGVLLASCGDDPAIKPEPPKPEPPKPEITFRQKAEKLLAGKPVDENTLITICNSIPAFFDIPAEAGKDQENILRLLETYFKKGDEPAISIVKGKILAIKDSKKVITNYGIPIFIKNSQLVEKSADSLILVDGKPLTVNQKIFTMKENIFIKDVSTIMIDKVGAIVPADKLQIIFPPDNVVNISGTIPCK